LFLQREKERKKEERKKEERKKERKKAQLAVTTDCTVVTHTTAPV